MSRYNAQEIVEAIIKKEGIKKSSFPLKISEVAVSLVENLNESLTTESNTVVWAKCLQEATKKGCNQSQHIEDLIKYFQEKPSEIEIKNPDEWLTVQPAPIEVPNEKIEEILKILYQLAEYIKTLIEELKNK